MSFSIYYLYGWGVYISECRHIQERPIGQNFPLFIPIPTSCLVTGCFSKPSQFILFYVLTPKQSKIENCILFHIMPVGIPKIQFLVPGDDEASWVELYNRLFYQRLLFLGQEIDSEVSNRLLSMMIYLSLADYTRDLYLFINSPGGKLIPGMALFDGMQFVEADVQTICVGEAASMASFVLVGGQITKRLAFPHARVMIHQPASSLLDGQTKNCILESFELHRMREIMTQIYAQRTGRPSWQIAEDMQRNSYMSAEDAQAYGIIDMITTEAR